METETKKDTVVGILETDNSSPVLCSLYRIVIGLAYGDLMASVDSVINFWALLGSQIGRILWVIPWLRFVSQHPGTCKYIKEDEKKALLDNIKLHMETETKKRKTPWLAFMKRTILALFFAHFADDFTRAQPPLAVKTWDIT
uniref:Innexin n=1 Tax=Rhabditophanes sp. KR3021 TaxID=114890 RepID=A0AC35U2Q1_9BILA